MAKIRTLSCSHENLTANLARELFTVDERMMSNVAGKCGKAKINPKIINENRKATFQMFPPTPAENQKQLWSACIRAIDSASKSLVRKTGKENTC